MLPVAQFSLSRNQLSPYGFTVDGGRFQHDAGYDGYFSVEVIHEPGSEHDAEGVLKQYAEEFRRIMAERQ